MWKKFILQDKHTEMLLPFSQKEKRLLAGKSVFVVLALDYFFYQSFWALLPLSVIGVMYWRMEKKGMMQKKREQVREQFKELMLLVSTGQRAGFSAENAFISSYQDMKALYGEESAICRVIKMLRSGKENNIPFSRIWKEIGDRLAVSEIKEFAQVYEISHESSGNMSSIMDKTADIIVRRIDTEKEIAVLLSARKLEQRIMNLMPFAIMLYISISSPGYFQGLYHSLGGAMIMSFCLLLYLSAYVLSVKMISIEI